MSRNHLKTSKRAGMQKGPASLSQAAGQGFHIAVQLPPERSEAWTSDWAPKHRAPVLGSPTHTKSSSERLQALCPLEKDKAHWRHSHLFSIPYSQCFSSLHPLIIIFLFFGLNHILIFLILFLFLLLLFFTLLLLILLLLDGDFFVLFCLCGFCLLCCIALFCQHRQNNIQDMVGHESFSQPATEENPPVDGPTTIKTQIQQESPHKLHKVIPRASSSGDQGDYTSESHRTPTT